MSERVQTLLVIAAVELLVVFAMDDPWVWGWI